MPQKYLAGLLSLAALPAMADGIDFNRDIRPILTSHCTACHGGVKEAGGISFVFQEKALATGDSGKRTIVAGDPDASELMRRVTSRDPELVMPQPEHGPPLPEEEVRKLRQWIQEGAKWNEHWAFVKPVLVPPPGVRQGDWPKNTIDHFVLARLEAEKLPPNPEAEPALLLRRLSIDLTGLPPTLGEVDAFESAWKSDPEAAWQREIDRLLAPPHYGERWASNWLDLARYADTEGLGHDLPRPAWPFRDWVVRAYNGDMPFDEFTIKQIAGDLLPSPTIDDLLATNFHRQSQNNGEGGADDEEFRVAAVMDRVATTWEAWQGVTMACVQCHSHPYDPILHHEYYNSFAFFNNTRDYDLSQHYPLLPAPKEQAMAENFTAWWKERGSLLETNHANQQALREATAWQPAGAMRAESKQVTLEVKAGEGNPEFLVKGTAATGSVFDLRITPPASVTNITALRVEVLPVDPATAIHTPEWGAILSKIQLHVVGADGTENPIAITRVIGDEPDPFFDPQQSLADSATGWGAFPKIDRPRSCILIFTQPVQATNLRLTLSQKQNAALSIPMVAKRGRVYLTDDPRWTTLANDPGEAASLARISEIDGALAKNKAADVPIMDAVAENLQRPTHLFRRGNWLDKDQALQSPGIPSLFGALPTHAPADRLAFARWLVSTENPMTARVAVNRMWEQLFGRGLVETLEDFGSSGDDPSHPELLDYLALRFRDHYDWSQKAMLREIVSSATYRQSAAMRPDHDVDPHNRLLARGPRVRLSAEAVRDHGLVASGLLAPKLYGPPVFPPMPEGGWTPFESQEKWETPPPGHADRYRRSLYTYIKHTNPYPAFATFDAPTRELCTARRILSNTPLQALDTLNSPAHAEFARALARRMAEEIPGEPAAKIAAGHRMTTSRPPSEARLKELLGLYEKLGSQPSAYTTIAKVLLNLDDALVK
ncbi:MAG: PSD1 and planctomycete cytochrome C domain-containing protein [Verrucomicrobiales bacterium]